MKKKVIAIGVISLLIVVSLVSAYSIKKNQKYIMQDGVMLALTLDGESITTFPSGTNYRVNVTCENGKGKWLPDDWKLAVEEISGNVICNIDFTTRTNSDNLKAEVESKATEISLINNVGTSETSNRYTGKQPDNWVWFNNEKWRIIGSIPVCLESSCSSKENLVKIIRAETLGGLAFDSSTSYTIWGGNTLYNLLNNYYYGKKDATGASPCLGYSGSLYYGLCDYKEVGISSSTTDYYGKMIKDVYWNIGYVTNINTTIANSYKLETATISSVSTKIGLMSASDYGYASGQTTVGLSGLSSYTQTNWLYGQGYEWTITPSSSSHVMGVYYNGYVYYYESSYGFVIRPVVYLDSSVYIVSGDGTEANPYQIGM